MLDGFLCLLNLNTYKDGIDIRAPHLDHFLQKDLNLRDLISETTLHKRVIGQHDLHYNLIATVMVVHLLTTAHTDIADHIANDTIARQQFVVAEHLNISRCHDTVVGSQIITRQTSQGTLLADLIATHDGCTYLMGVRGTETCGHGKRTGSIERGIHIGAGRSHITNIHTAVAITDGICFTQQEIDTW